MPSETAKRYIEAVGRRKTSIARVRITESPKSSLTVNEKELATYFPLPTQRNTAISALNVSGTDKKFTITVKVVGGGLVSQAEAVRHGISRALIAHDQNLRGVLKKEGFLRRDARAKERRKFGLKKARKAPQWSKR